MKEELKFIASVLLGALIGTAIGLAIALPITHAIWGIPQW